VELSAVEVVRVEAGAPRFGAEFGPDHFPQETGLEDAVSYTKGCYLGQEVIARIHYRGGVNRRLCGLEFGGAPPLAGTELGFEGRPAGTIGTALWSPTLGRAVGLALLHRRAAATGTLLAVATGGVATVRDLPLVAERRGGGAGEGEGGLATR
jgi:folate-binding protein YgfZ